MKNYTDAKTFETKQEIIVSVYWEIYKENVRIVLKVHILNSKLREYGAGGSASLSVDVIITHVVCFLIGKFPGSHAAMVHRRSLNDRKHGKLLSLIKTFALNIF